jgi:signal transduction histidine kinase
MNLKQRFSVLFSFLFSILLAAVMVVVYYLSSNFRTEEFQDRLSEKAETTVKLLVEVKEVDYQLLKIIDKNTINRLYNEKILVFNDSLQLIYSSIDDATIHWTKEDLDYISKNKVLFKKSKEYDVLGQQYRFHNKPYYVLISAEDKYGNRKLSYLKYLLASAFLSGISLVWVLSFYLSKRSLQPLDKVRKQIQEITVKNLNTRLPETKREDEINALSQSFNQMMDRIDEAYSRQKEFTGNASHELRTPIARIVTQLENVLQNSNLNPQTEKTLKSITEDSYQLSDMVTSLLLLSELDNKGNVTAFRKIRLDEIIFHTSAQLSQQYPGFKLQFEIENTSERDIDIEIKGDETLLKTAIANLFKNAYAYSDNKIVKCLVRQNQDNIQLIITNTGEVPDVADTAILFNTFTRGSNTHHKPGSGVGLSIVQRVLQYHHASVVYNIYDNYINEVVLTFTN